MMIALTVCYKSNVALDADYYYAKHLPLVAEKLTAFGLKNTEVRKILGTPAGEPAPYQLIATLYFDYADTLQQAMASVAGQAVVGDIPNFFDGMPDLMIGQIVA